MIVEREDRSGIAILRMNRGKVNALDAELLRALVEVLDEVEASTAGAVVLTGAGSAFSAGVDLFRLLDGGPAYIREFLPLLDAALLRLFSFPKPTVAAVNGHAIAGGHLLMAACDRRLMAKGGGKLGVPELLVGVPFPPMALEILRATLAPQVLQDLAYTGRTVGAEEAVALGVLHELAEPGELLTRALAQARLLAAVPAPTYRLVKRQILAPALERAERLQAEVGDELAAIWESAESLEAIRSYLARAVGRRG
jgi:enoyl-CoA hydratase